MFEVKLAANIPQTNSSLNCTVTLDTKTTKTEIYWRSDIEPLNKTKIYDATAYGVKVSEETISKKKTKQI